MVFTYNEVNIDITCEGHQSWWKMCFRNILKVLDDHDTRCQNWLIMCEPHCVKVVFFMKLTHSQVLWHFDKFAQLLLKPSECQWIPSVNVFSEYIHCNYLESGHIFTCFMNVHSTHAWNHLQEILCAFYLISICDKFWSFENGYQTK